LRQIAVLTPGEVEILENSIQDPNLFTDYFFRPFGADKGWKFDDNFTAEGKWQLEFHQALQTDITMIGGFGTGKTLGVAMSASTYATLTADFKFLNVAQKQWQAKQMYDMILLQARNTRFDALIWEKPRKPHAKIVLCYKIGRNLYESTLEFMSVDKDATGILSWEGDWINIDEAGLLDNLEDVIINVGSRMRGTVRGRERLGRFSMTSNSWDNFHLWYYFDQAMADPENFLSMVVSSRHNKNVTEKQLQRMVARIPASERDRFIDATRPTGKGQYFDRDSVVACEDPHTGKVVIEMIDKKVPGYIMERIYGAGIYHFQIPPEKNQLYMFYGDPGTGAAPHRSAPVCMVWKVTNFPKMPCDLVAFWWGNGGSRIGPFVDKMLDLLDLYRPVRVFIDSTSTQKNMNTLINEHVFRKKFGIQENDDGEIIDAGYESPLGMVRGIRGLDFSGSGKSTYLQAARLFIEHGLLRWPEEIVGIRSQLANYDPERDKKIAQDIVATIGMSAYGIRVYFHVSPEDLLAQVTAHTDESPVPIRRNPQPGRSRRSTRAHKKEPVAY
jgi:hypothetical protein